MRVAQDLADIGIRRLASDDTHGVDRSAADAAAEAPNDHRRIAHLACTIFFDALMEGEGADVARDRIEAAGVDDAGTAPLGGLVELVDRRPHEGHLAGEIDVVGALLGTGFDEFLAVAQVGSDGRAHDAGTRGHLPELLCRVGVGDDERPLRRGRRQFPADLFELGTRAPGERDARALRCMLGEIGRRELSDEARGSENDDVELSISHGA